MQSGASLRVRQGYAQAAEQSMLPYFGRFPFSHGAAPPPNFATGNRFYDDNAWVGEVFLHAYAISGLKPLLRAAEGVMAFERTGEWHKGEGQKKFPGGEFWNTFRRYRTLDASAGAVQLALRLYLVTYDSSNPQERYLARQDLYFAKRVYGWVRRTLANSHGLYSSHLYNGTVAKMGEINGQAMMARDGYLLYRATHWASYLVQAQTTRAAIWRHWPTAESIEGIKPVYTFQTFYNVSNTTLLSQYTNWIAANTRHGVFLLTAKFHGKPVAPCPQSGATGVLILRERASGS